MDLEASYQLSSDFTWGLSFSDSWDLLSPSLFGGIIALSGSGYDPGTHLSQELRCLLVFVILQNFIGWDAGKSLHSGTQLFGVSVG